MGQWCASIPPASLSPLLLYSSPWVVLSPLFLLPLRLQTTHKVKMPYKMLVGVRKAQKTRAVKAEQERVASGVITGTRSDMSIIKKRENRKQQRAEKRRRGAK